MFVGLLLSAVVRANINASQLLVVYNSAAGEAVPLRDHYLAAHPDIPSSNVFDLNDISLVGVADITSTTYLNSIATPIKNYLQGGNGPTPASIVAICLLRPMPHRIQDTDYATVGDIPNVASTEFINGDATYASVDSELVLLFQSLYNGEAGGTMDSLADNVIDNPYHTVTVGIDTYSRSNITVTKTFSNLSSIAWGLSGSGSKRLTPGDIYLVCRIDGATLADAMAIIDRARNPIVNKPVVRILMDENDTTVPAGNPDLDDDALFQPPVFMAGDDYEEARDVLVADGWNVDYDGTSNWIDGSEYSHTLIAYASYGENHYQSGVDPSEDPPGNGTYIERFVFARGAIFNTLESYNARAFNGLGTLFSQEQIADFITAGGTFAVGLVWEPFSIFIPDNEFLFASFLVHRLTFAEAAYASFPALSWQTLAVGDPLAAVTQLSVGDFDVDGDTDGFDFLTFANCYNGSGRTPLSACTDSSTDLDLDGDVDGFDFLTFSNCYNGSNRSPLCE